MKKTTIALATLAAMFVLPSCLKSDIDQYDKWRDLNNAFTKGIDTLEYKKFVPDWAPGNSVYVKWYNDRSLTANNLMPISTSTVSLKYEMQNIDGTPLGNSYKANGDSLYTSVVGKNIIGFQIALMQMHVGDSVRMIIPYQSGYGSSTTGGIAPYSNLIYDVKLVSIPAYEKAE